MKTLVIGLGNPILSDDGIGIYTARRVQELLPEESPIEVIEVSVGGITLMEHMVGYERVIIIDAMWAPADQAGQVHVFDASNLPETLNTRSTHDADLPTALRIGRELGAKLPEMHHVQIVAITANQVLDFCEELTPAVQAAMPDACTAVFRLLSIPASSVEQETK
ncbi:MAG: hydrogenase maturation protease [Chloroflexi bacterium]|nr:hydrogenase maturation protease [Chloroflexota bacterium]